MPWKAAGVVGSNAAYYYCRFCNSFLGKEFFTINQTLQSTRQLAFRYILHAMFSFQVFYTRPCQDTLSES